MKFKTQSPLRVLLFSLILIFQFSCTKDSDLLTDYVLADAKEDLVIGQFVVDDTFETTIDDAIILDVLANDAFENQEEVLITETSSPSNGTVELNNDNTLTYIPDPEIIEQIQDTTNVSTPEVVDTFTYTTEVVNENETVSTEIGNVEVVVVSTVNRSGQLLVDEGFEGGNASFGLNGTFKEENSDATIVVGNAREGNNAVRFTGAAGGSRSEVAIREGTPTRYYDWGAEYWQGIAVKVVSPVGGYGIALQHHAIPSGNPDKWVNSAGSNSFTLTTDSTHLTFWTATDPNDVNENPGNTSALGDQVGHRVPYIQNQWIDIVSHFRLASDNTGFYEIWVDGVKIVDIHNNPTIYLYDTGGEIKFPYDYSKIGIYYGSGFAEGEVHYDSFRILKGEGSYESVSPGD